MAKKAHYIEVYEKEYGPVGKGKCVHHCDGDHSHDIASNLVAISRGHHFLIHRLMKQLPLDILFKIGEGILNYVIAEKKRETSKKISNNISTNKEKHE